MAGFFIYYACSLNMISKALSEQKAVLQMRLTCAGVFVYVSLVVLIGELRRLVPGHNHGGRRYTVRVV